MMRMRVDFFAETLGLSTSMTVLLPQSADGQIGLVGRVRSRTPVLYLLHGLSDDDTIWTRRTSIERYAAELGLAVVMPAVGTSFYCDEANGKRYWTFVSEELPALVKAAFNVSDRREDSFVAGLSMGGYGAFKLALRRPDRFAAAGSLSGALDLAERQESGDLALVQAEVWGDSLVRGTSDDLFALLDAADPASLPRIWLSCGTEDALVHGNRRFVEAADAHGVHVERTFRPGVHEWGFWDAGIEHFLNWLDL